MGGSASTGCTVPRRKAPSAFIDDTLLEGEAILKKNAVVRKSFVEYIKGGEWADDLSPFEDIWGALPASSECVWKSFGYHTPRAAGAKTSKSTLQLSTSSFQLSSSSGSGKSMCTVEPAMDALTSSTQVYVKMVMNDCYTAISTSQLFMKEELRPILIAALLPLFFKSTECIKTGDSSGWNSEKEDEEEEDECTVNICAKARLICPKCPKVARLQEYFLGAAAMFDGSELDAYMSDVTASWIDDYLRAIHNLPVTVTLSAVDPVKKESKIVYANASRGGFFGGKSQVGANIHDLFSENTSTSNEKQVAQSVFTARRYKRSMQEANGMCRLRALKPVHDASGQHVYALGLESYPFEDPALQEGYAMLDEEPFQQIEDLLLMLPMLVRNFNSAGLQRK